MNNQDYNTCRIVEYLDLSLLCITNLNTRLVVDSVTVYIILLILSLCVISRTE